MFNYAAQAVTSFSPGKVLGGADVADSTSYRTLFCGPDPADPERVLVRKILELSNGRYAYEETTITPNQDAGVPSVHTTAWKIHGWDMKEEVTQKEINTRLMHRPMPNSVAFSLYYRKTNGGTNHLSIVENTLWKPNYSWNQMWADWNDRRDLSKYLKFRWMLN